MLDVGDGSVGVGVDFDVDVVASCVSGGRSASWQVCVTTRASEAA